jgi:hypothetical protein
MQTSQDNAATGISRREAIRRAALLAGIALSPGWLSLVDRARPAAQAAFLSPAHLAMTGAIAERILPRTNTPGALDVGVPATINVLYGEFMMPVERQMLTTGLDAVEAASQSTHRAPFTSLTANQQDDLLRDIARAEEDRPQGFFRMFRSATILAYFTSEEVGRNVLHYEPIPGRYDSCVPIDDVGRRNWTT